MKKRKNMFQMKEQDKAGGRGSLNQTEISKLYNKGFKVMLINVLTELGRRLDEHSKNFHEEMENIGKFQTEVTELLNIINTLSF